MGTWGTALYSDDLAADLREDFRNHIGEGLKPSVAVARLLAEYGSPWADRYDESVFWLVVADTAWKTGHIDSEIVRKALQIIEAGADLDRWDGKDRRKREATLSKLHDQLLQPPPPPKRIRNPVKAATDWDVGDVVAFEPASGRFTLFRVIGHHEDKGGRFAVCELLDWTGSSIPPEQVVQTLTIRREVSERGVSQFLFPEPKTKRDKARVTRTGLRSKPLQKCRGYSVFVWPHVDVQLKEVFGLE